MVMAAWMGTWMGCGAADPFQGAPPLPEHIDDHTVYAIEVQGRVSGTEERWRGRSDGAPVVVRRRTWSVVLGGEAATLRAASRVVGAGPVSAYERWIEGATEHWTGAAWVPDAVPPPETGLWPVLEPWTLEVQSTEVTIDGPTVRWTTSAGETRATFEGGQLSGAEHGAIRMARVDEKPSTLVPFDPAALFAVPAAPQPRVRTALVGVFEVDGRTQRVDTPTWAEIRNERLPERVPDRPLAAEARSVVGDAEDVRTAVQRLVRHVADGLDGQPRPGSLAAVEALQSGRGDCDEAAAAFVALAQALGLEAAPVGGLVYANGAVGPGLYPHAWAQVRIGGRMVPVDPALGQAPADASHLALGSGAGEAAARLASGIRVRLVRLR